MVRVPVRGTSSRLSLTTMVTVPLPMPPVSDVIVIQAASLTAAQEQVLPAVTLISHSIPTGVQNELLGEIE